MSRLPQRRRNRERGHDQAGSLRERVEPAQKGTLKALGLGRIGRSVERKDSPQLQGQIRVVSHLVEVDGG